MIKIERPALLGLFLLLPLLGNAQQIPTTKNSSAFVEAKKDFPREEKNRRKWDAPVVADLDQDGYLDLLLNDHGFGVSVCWNNGGQFAKPYDIIMGDLHGLSVGDYDQDGLLDLIISRGGGSGSNARNSKMYTISKDRNITAVPDFDEPLALMRGRTVKFVDGDNDGLLDLLNFAFPDKDKKGETENYIYRNIGQGQMVEHATLPAIKTNGQKTLLTDLNSDGIVDLVIYGHGPVKIYQGNGDLTYVDVTKKTLGTDIEEVTGAVEIDYDNDGDFDLFFSRGSDFKKGETFYDATTETWGFFTTRGDFRFEDLPAGDILEIENYQAQWPVDDEVLIGESGYNYTFEGETHSGKDMKLKSSDALGFPDTRTKKGIYVGYVGNQSWRIAGDIFSPTTGVVHGVKSYPSVKHPKGYPDLLLENKKGKLVETKNMPFVTEEHTMGVATADLDNNGLMDLILVNRGDLIHTNESTVYLNQGSEGFQLLKNHQIIAPELGSIGMAIETLDYNKDGQVDVVVGNERGKWHLFENTVNNGNNFVIIQVGTSPSGKATGLGAIVTLQSCDQSQVKRVGATGASYSLSFNNQMHFGLGSCTQPVKVKVVWSNGEQVEKRIDQRGTTVSMGR